MRWRWTEPVVPVLAILQLAILQLAGGCADEPRSDWPLRINEVLPSNDDGCADDEDEHNDWIELTNIGQSTVSLEGVRLTDDSATPDKTVLDDRLSLEPGGFLLLWADNSDDLKTGAHLSFKLNANWDKVIVYDPEGRLIDEVRWQTSISTDVSLARLPDGTGEFALCGKPTCGKKNGAVCGN